MKTHTQTQQAASTPTPWQAVNMYSAEADIRDMDGERIALVRGSEKTERETKANATFIVKAVNAHQELVDLLITALPYVEEGEEFNKPHAPKLSAKIRAALAKANA